MKVVLVRSLQESFWNSCKSIVSNLESAYGSDLEIFDYHHELEDQNLLEKMILLKENKTEELIFIDHYPALTKFFTALDLFSDVYRPKITIHAFGDFAPRCQEYLKIEDILKKFPLKIYAPSTRSAGFLATHVASEQPLIHVLPFAINSHKFFFQEDLRQQSRTMLELSPTSKLLTYAGRISSQKNTLFTLDLVSEYLRKDPDALFVLAGSDDNFGTPLFGQVEARGSMAISFKEALDQLEPEVRKRIRYVNNLPTEKLISLLHATDLFVSFSTYHNEDFGMGPLEALCVGCPALLTDWGGYSDFKGDGCHLVKVTLDEHGLKIDKNSALQKISDLLKERDPQVRVARSKKYLSNYSEQAIRSLLQKHRQTPHVKFEGFSEVVRSYFWLSQGLAKLEPKEKTLYDTLYRSYFE